MSLKKYPHFSDCKCNSGKKVLTKQHPWWVDAPDYHNCFWVYLRHNDKIHTLQEVSKLLGLSISAITSTEKKAINKLKKKIAFLQYNE